MRRPVLAPKQVRLEQHARTMRRQPTTTEALLWQALRGSQLGVGFRRQHVVGPYIVDFCAPSVRLVVEVDGGYHVARAKADARRDRQLGELGYVVLRVSDALVLHDLEQVIALVLAALGKAG